MGTYFRESVDKDACRVAFIEGVIQGLNMSKEEMRDARMKMIREQITNA